MLKIWTRSSCRNPSIWNPSVPAIARAITLSPKRLQNEWSLIASVIRKYTSSLDDVLRNIELPEVPERVPDLIPAEVLLPAIKDTELELPVLLAAWLSFSMSEIRGLTKSKSISGDHIRIAEVVVVVAGKDHRKEIAKNKYRNRAPGSRPISSP